MRFMRIIFIRQDTVIRALFQHRLLMKKVGLLFFLFAFNCLSSYSQFWSKRDFSLSMNFDVECEPGTTFFRMIALVPTTHAGIQEIEKLAYNIQPDSVYYHKNTCFAEFKIENPDSNFTITVDVEGRLYNNDYKTANSEVKLSEEELNDYLTHTEMCEVDSPAIQTRARRLEALEEKTIEKIHVLWDEIQSIPFFHEPKADAKSALEVIKEGKANCVGKSHIFIALCRATGIPARLVCGLAPTTGHGWPEVYIEKKGWVKFEPTHSNERNYQRIKGNHIRLSEGIFTYRGLNTNQRIHWWWNWKGKSTQCKVNENHKFRILRSE